MSIRDELLTQLNTNLATHTAFSVSSELPFNSAGEALYTKNMKTVYLDEDQQEELYDYFVNDIVHNEMVDQLRLLGYRCEKPTPRHRYCYCQCVDCSNSN